MDTRLWGQAFIVHNFVDFCFHSCHDLFKLTDYPIDRKTAEAVSRRSF